MTNKEKKSIITVATCFMVLCSVLLVGARDLREADVLSLCNATDSLILLTELATESSKDYIQAKADHVEMLNEYVKYMKNRNGPWLFENDIAEKLKLVIKSLKKDEKKADQQVEAGIKIETASKTIAEFLSKHRLFMDKPVVGSEYEVVSEEMQTTVRKLLDEADKKTQTYINDLNMVNSEVAYRANRKVIVYLYLVRSQWSEVITSEERINLAEDINRTIYWNRILKKRSDTTERERSRLTKCSVNEHRHLQLLRAITDNDMRDVHGWLKLAIKKAFPNDKFFVEE